MFSNFCRELKVWKMELLSQTQILAEPICVYFVLISEGKIWIHLFSALVKD